MNKKLQKKDKWLVITFSGTDVAGIRLYRRVTGKKGDLVEALKKMLSR